MKKCIILSTLSIIALSVSQSMALNLSTFTHSANSNHTCTTNEFCVEYNADQSVPNGNLNTIQQDIIAVKGVTKPVDSWTMGWGIFDGNKNISVFSIGNDPGFKYVTNFQFTITKIGNTTNPENCHLALSGMKESQTVGFNIHYDVKSKTYSCSLLNN